MRYLNEEYREKLAELSADADVTQEKAERLFCERCEELRERLRDDAPLRAVRAGALMALENSDEL